MASSDRNERFGNDFKGNRDTDSKFDKYDRSNHYGVQQTNNSYNRDVPSDNRNKSDDHRGQNQAYGNSYSGNYKNHGTYTPNNQTNSNGQAKPFFSTQNYEPQANRSVRGFESNSSNFVSGQQKYGAPTNAPAPGNQYAATTGKVLSARQNIMGNVPPAYAPVAYGSKGNLPQDNQTGIYSHQ